MAFLGTEWRRSSSRLDQDGRGPPPLPRASRRLAWGCSWLSRLSVSSTPLWPSVQTWVVDTDATQTKDARVHGPLTPRKPRDTRYPTPLSPSAPLLIAARVCPSFVSAGLGATSAPRFLVLRYLSQQQTPGLDFVSGAARLLRNPLTFVVAAKFGVRRQRRDSACSAASIPAHLVILRVRSPRSPACCLVSLASVVLIAPRVQRAKLAKEEGRCTPITTYGVPCTL